MFKDHLKKLDDLSEQCKKIWVPRWFKEFSDDENGGFYERLGEDGKPLPLAKRLLTQCRQIIVYSNYYLAIPNDAMKQKIESSFQFLVKKYLNPETNGFHFSLSLDGQIEDTKYDLYGHTFVLLACAAIYKTFKNEQVLQIAKETFNFLNQNFRIPNAPGFAEALDKDLKPTKGMRRQNPHMHLMEASMSMYEVSKDPAYLLMAQELLGIFNSYFFDKKTSTLREFFDDMMIIHPVEGHLVEAGHHCEWIWLLSRFQEINAQKDLALTDTMKKLFSWVLEYGFDKKNGGIYNSQNSEGITVDTQKRIWPVFEALRASVIMSQIDGFYELSEAALGKTLSLLKIYVANDGSWIEILSQDLKPVTNYRPGTTPYHICLPLMEVHAYHSRKS